MTLPTETGLTRRQMLHALLGAPDPRRQALETNFARVVPGFLVPG